MNGKILCLMGERLCYQATLIAICSNWSLSQSFVHIRSPHAKRIHRFFRSTHSDCPRPNTIFTNNPPDQQLVIRFKVSFYNYVQVRSFHTWVRIDRFFRAKHSIGFRIKYPLGISLEGLGFLLVSCHYGAILPFLSKFWAEIRGYTPPPSPVDDVIFGNISETPGYYRKSASTSLPPYFDMFHRALRLSKILSLTLGSVI